ncbi:MAG: hypothetical protein Q8O14_14825 [bacterium]|nr:hypothetical protein [bacterium]
MWLFTTLGYYSITRSRLEPDRYQIRARDRQHLERLSVHMDLDMMARMSLGQIIETPSADYRWRIIVDERQLRAVVEALARCITYFNFKTEAATTAAADHSYRAALHDVWARMNRLQHSTNLETPHA